MWDFWGMGWGMWFWIILLIGAGFLFYQWTRYSSTSPKEDPLYVAQLRLARGEITAEEYERIKTIITKEQIR